MFFNTCSNSKDIGIKDDIFRRKPDFIDQQSIRACTDINFALCRVGLTILIKRHYNNCCAILQTKPGVLEKFLFTFLHANRVNNTLTLRTLQTGFNHFPLGTVDHQRDTGNVRFSGNQFDKSLHRHF